MRGITLALVSILVASSTHGAEACGDKFLRVGRGARYQRSYVALHPTGLLLFARRGSAVAPALRELEPALKRAGHRPLVVEDVSAVAPALSSGRFTIILADFRDLPSVERAVRASGAKVDVLPFFDQPSPAERDTATQAYRCIAESPGKKAKVLGEIDELEEIALKGTGEGNRRQP